MGGLKKFLKKAESNFSSAAKTVEAGAAKSLQTTAQVATLGLWDGKMPEGTGGGYQDLVNAGAAKRSAEELQQAEDAKGLREAADEQIRRSMGGRASTLLGGMGGGTSMLTGSIARRTLGGY